MIAFEQRLRLDYIDGRTWMLVDPVWFVYEGGPDVRFQGSVPAKFITDFHSIPRFFWRVLFPTHFAHASVIHDFLYRSAGLPRVHCDRAYLEALELLRAPRWKRWAMYLGVRVGGWAVYGKSRHQVHVEKADV